MQTYAKPVAEPATEELDDRMEDLAEQYENELDVIAELYEKELEEHDVWNTGGAFESRFAH